MNWEEIQSAVGEAFTRVQASPVLDAVAKGALKQIPLVGDILADVYESSGESEEDKARKLENILEHIKGFQAEQFEALNQELTSTRAQLRRDSNALDTIFEKTAEIAKRLALLQETTDEIHRLLVGVDVQLDYVAQGTYVFDVEVKADRLNFLLQLQRLLGMTKKAFNQQVKLGKELLERTEYQPKAEGVDDALREGFEYIQPDDRQLFSELRRITDHTSKINNQIRRLLGTNRALFHNELAPLYEHLSTFLAKYEVLKDDPRMCLVYVGVVQESPFPPGVDSFVIQQINELREETLLDSSRLG